MFYLLQESRESQVSTAAATSDELAAGPLFSDRTDDTDKIITRYVMYLINLNDMKNLVFATLSLLRSRRKSTQLINMYFF